MGRRRSFAVVLSFVMVLTMLVGAPTVAQEDPDFDWGASSNFDKVLLTGDVGEPMTFDITSDGRVFLTDRSGVLRIYNPDTGNVTVAAEIDTYSSPHYPGGNNEGGLLGVALDPDFDDNQRIYLYYSDPVPSGDRVFLSRFEMDGDTLDLDSEIILLEVPSQREACCHLAGDLQFGPEGYLYLSTGDETLANCANQYAPINEDPDSAWFPHCDAQGTAGDSSDLRGSVLRIIPLDDPSGEPGVGNTYDVPGDNLFTSGKYDHLFPDGEYDPELGRPEIFVMGARNPFRIALDPETGWLYYGMYGPNNPQWHPERGPMGFDQWHQAREASNQGWPYCTGNLYPYRPWDFAANQPKGDFFDCEGGPVNNSPNNGGLNKLPPVTPAIIYYPTNWANYPYEVPEPFHNLGATGAGGPNGGPIYRYDEDLDSDTKFPEHFDGRWFLLDYHRNHLKTAELDEGGDLVDIDHFMGATTWISPHAAKFGPEGSLYVLEYGTGGFSPSPVAALYRIDWVGEGGDDVEQCFDFTTDEFDGDELDRDTWPEIVRENPDGYRVEDGALVIDTLQGDMIINAGTPVANGQNLIMQPVPEEGGWQATTEITINPAGQHHHAGFVVYGDNENFIKASLSHAGSFEFLQHANGALIRTPGDVHPVPGGHPGTFQVRLTSTSGTNVSIAYSVDEGDTWVPFGSTLPLPNDARIALYAAGGPNPATIVPAAFHWFELGLPGDYDGPNDDFEGDELDRCIWTRIVRPEPSAYRVQDGALEIDTLQGDQVINAGNPVANARNLIMQPLPDGVGWEATTAVSISVNENHQHAGFVIYGDDENFIKATMGTSANFEFLLHQDGQMVRTPGDVHGVPGGHPTDYQVRLTSVDGTTATIAYSLNDGETWTSFGSELPLPDNPYIALNAARGPNPGQVIPAQFHWFTLEEFELVCPDLPEVPEGFTALYDHVSLGGWNQAGPGGFEIHPCGLLQPWGGMGLLWYEAEEFTDYVVRTEFRQHNPTDNSGVFVRFPHPQGDPWNPVDEGFEIQIYEATTDPAGRTGAVYTFAPSEPVATNPLGEWNTMDIEVVGDTFTVTLNGVQVSTYTNTDPNRGQGPYIGLQNHAAGMGPGQGVEFRGVWIQDLSTPEVPTVDASLDPSDPDGNDDWWVSPVTLTLESDPQEVTAQWREAGTEEWTDYDGSVTFDDDGTYDLEYRAIVGDDGDDPPDEATVLAGVGGDFFAPDAVTIGLGGTVTFEAADFGHHVVIDDSYGDRVGEGGDFGGDWVYEFTPDATGVFTFRCLPHPNMDGTITVVDAGSGGPQVSEIGEVSFRIDQTPPVSEATLAGEEVDDRVYVGDVALTLHAQDATSGVAQVHWRVAGDDDHEVYDGPVTFDEPGEYTVEFRSVDVAGNVAEWQAITFEIIDDAPPVDLELEVAASARCVAGSVYVTVTARNDSEVPVDIELDSELGSRAFVGVVPDRFASHAFNTRAGSVDAGSVTVRASAVVDGVEVEVEQTVDFEALSCG